SPQAYTPNLAGSLNNLAIRLSEVGERAEALVAAREAVGLYRGLAEESPAAYTPNLAMSMSNLSNCLSAVGDWEAALEVAREARQLVDDLPQAAVLGVDSDSAAHDLSLNAE
ncbi:tetratricopeptide repeat protein, partial [Actinomyces sp. oral taxon 172]